MDEVRASVFEAGAERACIYHNLMIPKDDALNNRSQLTDAGAIWYNRVFRRDD